MAEVVGRRLAEEGFLKRENREDLVVAGEIGEILERFRAYEAMESPIWIERAGDGR